MSADQKEKQSTNTNNEVGIEDSGERIILTTYPGQIGIKPLPLNWGAPTSKERGPVLCSRSTTGNNFKNSIGYYSGSYSIYRALAVASRQLDPHYKPDFHNTYPPVQIGPHPSWQNQKEIVSLDPYGHEITRYFGEEVAVHDIRPTIAVTKAHMKVPEITDLIREGKLAADGVILKKDGEIGVIKAAIEPVWFLPGVAERFGIDEVTLRRHLFMETGGMYPELITRPDLKVFLPPIGGMTVYIFGSVEHLSDPTKRLTVRVHDECNGSDVFSSDICTCRPYLIYGMELSVREAQAGGCGVVVYFRKEGRALGEVTKFLVYNARKRQEGGDKASTYFKRTENVAGVKDMRFQALMPDVLHWLGIKKIDRFVSMSNMKYDAIVNSGIEIRERVAIPDEIMPPDSQVEIQAKIADGYFAGGKKIDKDQLEHVTGRNWDDIHH